MPLPRFRIQTLMIAVAVAAGSIAKLTEPGSPEDYVIFCPGPCVEGEIARVDTINGFVELGIGSDDGLMSGELLHAYGSDPRRKHRGTIRVVRVDPDTATAVILKTGTSRAQGVRAGDVVSTDPLHRSTAQAARMADSR